MSRSSLYPPSVDPGFPSLGPVPTGWTRTTFGSALEKVERPLDLEPDRKYRLVTAKRSRGGIVLRSELLGSEILTKTQFAARAGDFLISRRQIIHGACGVVPEDLDGAVVSNEYSTLRNRPGLLMDYLRHYCHTPYFQRTCFHSSHGVDVEKMIFKIDEWLAREVDLPPVEEQRKIAAILSSVDDAIEASQAVIDQLQVVRKAMMAELLTKSLPGRHKKFKQTEIGEVPEEWGVVSVEGIGKWLSGGTPSKSEARFWTGNIPWVSPKDMKIPRLADAIDHVSEEALAHGTQLAPAKSILMVVRGMILAHTFPVCLTLREVAFNQDVKALVLSSEFDPEFVLYWLVSRQHEVLQLVDVANHGTKRLPSERLFATKIPIPPLDEQRELSTILSSLDSRVRAESTYLDKLGNTKAALMSVLLTGEVRVRVDEEAAA